MRRKMRSAEADSIPKETMSPTGEGPLVEIPPEVLEDPLAEISYYQMSLYPLFPLSRDALKKKLDDFKNGKWKDLEPEFDGLQYFALFDKRKVPCLIIHDELFYPEEYREAIERKLEIAKKEFHLWNLLDSTPIPLKQLDKAQFRNLAQKCDLKVGILARNTPPEGIEVWVCAKHKEFYFLEEYLPTVKAAMHDLREPALLRSPSKNAR